MLTDKQNKDQEFVGETSVFVYEGFENCQTAACTKKKKTLHNSMRGFLTILLNGTTIHKQLHFWPLLTLTF